MDLEPALQSIVLEVEQLKPSLPDHKRCLLSDLNEIARQFTSTSQDRISKNDLRETWIKAITTARMARLQNALLKHELAFNTLDDWIWFDPSARLT